MTEIFAGHPKVSEETVKQVTEKLVALGYGAMEGPAFIENWEHVRPKDTDFRHGTWALLLRESGGGDPPDGQGGYIVHTGLTEAMAVRFRDRLNRLIAGWALNVAMRPGDIVARLKAFLERPAATCMPPEIVIHKEPCRDLLQAVRLEIEPIEFVQDGDRVTCVFRILADRPDRMAQEQGASVADGPAVAVRAGELARCADLLHVGADCIHAEAYSRDDFDLVEEMRALAGRVSRMAQAAMGASHD